MRGSHLINCFVGLYFYSLVWGHMQDLWLRCSFSLCYLISRLFLLFGMKENLQLSLGQLDRLYVGYLWKQ